MGRGEERVSCNYCGTGYGGIRHEALVIDEDAWRHSGREKRKGVRCCLEYRSVHWTIVAAGCRKVGMVGLRERSETSDQYAGL